MPEDMRDDQENNNSFPEEPQAQDARPDDGAVLEKTEEEIAWVVPARHHVRTVDWFWAIGIITIAGAITAFVVGNTLFGIFIILGGGLLFYTNLQSGEDTFVRVTEREVEVNGLRYISKRMKGFAVTKNSQEEDILIIRTDRFFMPTLILHIAGDVPLDDLENLLALRIPREDLREPPAHALAEKLGF